VSPARKKQAPDAAEAERERINRSFLALALAHELKQPLNALALNTDLLGRRLAKIGPAAAECKAPLESIGRVVDRVNGCLESFLTHVAPDPAPDNPVDLRPALESCLARARPVARNLGVRLLDEVPEDLPPLPVHPVQIGVALDALLDNALRATRRGNAVTLRALVDSDDVRLEVSDEGDGMTPDIAKHAVAIGFSSWGRPGIGLAVAKFIAYSHGGGFQLQSTEGKGTTVTLMLPVG
jgi:two-component system, NtrC family, sensor kinase